MSETIKPVYFVDGFEELTEVNPEQNLQNFADIAQRNHDTLLETDIVEKAINMSWYDDPEKLLHAKQILFCVHRKSTPYMTRIFVCAAPKDPEQDDTWLNAHVGDIVRISGRVTINHPEWPYTEKELDITAGMAEETEDTMKVKEITEEYPYLDILPT